MNQQDREEQVFNNFPKKYGNQAYKILKEETIFYAKQCFGTLSATQSQRLEQELFYIKQNRSEHIILFYRDLLRHLQKQAYVWFYSSQFNYSFVCYCLGITHIDPIKWNYPLRPIKFFKSNLLYVPQGITKCVAEFLLEEYGYEHIMVRSLSAKILRSDFYLSRQPFTNVRQEIEKTSFLPDMNIFEGIPKNDLSVLPLPVEEEYFPSLPHEATRRFFETHTFDDERVLDLIGSDSDSFIKLHSFDELLYLFRHGAALQYHRDSRLNNSMCKKLLEDNTYAQIQPSTIPDDFFLISAQNLYLKKYLSLYGQDSFCKNN